MGDRLSRMMHSRSNSVMSHWCLMILSYNNRNVHNRSFVDSCIWLLVGMFGLSIGENLIVDRLVVSFGSMVRLSGSCSHMVNWLIVCDLMLHLSMVIWVLDVLDRGMLDWLSMSYVGVLDMV